MQSSSLTSSVKEQEHVSCPVKVPVPPLHPAAHGVLQCLVTGLTASSQEFFSKDQTGDNVMVRR